MARKPTDDTEQSHGFDDIIGVVLLVAALVLLLSQVSFDRGDIPWLVTGDKKPTHNWIGPLGAYFAWVLFFPFGIVAYLIPPLLAAFGAAYLLNFLTHLRQRLRRSLLWTVGLFIALTGLLYIMDDAGWFGDFKLRLGSPSV